MSASSTRPSRVLDAIEERPRLAGRAGRGHRASRAPPPIAWPPPSRPTAWFAATTRAGSPWASASSPWGGRRPRPCPWPRPPRTALATLRDATGESVQLYVRDGDRRVCVAALESPHGLRTIVPLGAALPLGVGSAGRVLAAAARTGPARMGGQRGRAGGGGGVGVARRCATAPGGWSPRSACRARSSAPPASPATATAPRWWRRPAGWSATPACGKSDGVSERPLAAIDIGTNSFHMVVARVGEVDGGVAGRARRSR